MLKYQKSKRVLSLVLSIFMVMGCFAPNMLSQNEVYASQNEDFLSSTRVDLAAEAMNKIETQVMEDFENEELVEVMVYMNSQVDTEMVAYESQKALSATMTPYQTKLQVRRNVVEALRDNAETSQASIINYLNSEMEKGNVEDFETYTIVNMLYVKATREVVENLAYMVEVGKIYKNKTHTLDIINTEDADIQPAADGVEWNISNIRADEAWALGYDGAGVVVGIIDTGVDWTHPALKNKWRGYDPYTGETSAEGNWLDLVYNERLPADSDQHGTHVTGTILGQEPDGSNKVGVAPGAKWIAARVFGAGGASDAILLLAAEWMLQPGGNPDLAPDVINNSWGGGNGIDDWYRDAVKAWRAAGIVPIFAAGNQVQGEPAPWPGSIAIPANYPESIAVGAVDINNNLASFSKLGPSPYDETMIKPNLSAGGVNIRSSIPGGKYNGTFSGTSMAAPAVSGAVALILSSNPSLSVDEIQDLLQDTARPLTDSKYPEAPNMGYGHGIIDAFEAVASVELGAGSVSGRVFISGEDVSEATIEHEQQIFEAYMASDIEVIAQITDDVSVTEAELLVKQQGKSYWIVVPMTRISGNHRDGMYRGVISIDMMVEGQMTYKIKARDYAGDVVVSPDYNMSVEFGIIPGEYTQGFEENTKGWIFDGIWEHGVPTNVGPTAYEGEKFVATVIGRIPGGAVGGLEGWMIAPPIDLRDASLPTASLRFHKWDDVFDINIGIKPPDEGVYVLISDDYGETWTEVKSINTASMIWEETFINLNDYIGSPNPVLVAFRCKVSNNYYRAGWYIDNVSLMARDNEVPAVPTGLDISLSAKGIRLYWDASKEKDLSHYNIYRSENAEEGFEKIAEINVNIFTDSNAVAGTTYFYKISAEDFSGNESEFTEIISSVAPSLNVVFGTNFEENDGGFVAAGTYNSWDWGIPKTGPRAASSGDKLWATNLDGTHRRFSDCHITSAPITIPEDGETWLLFTHWVDIKDPDPLPGIGIDLPITIDPSLYLDKIAPLNVDKLKDYGQVQVSTDEGATWTDIGGQHGRRVQAWADVEISLTAYAGQTVQIRFLFHDEGYIPNEGWYIDDVYIINFESEDPVQEPDIPEELELSMIKKGYVEPSAPNYVIGTKAGSYTTIEDKSSTYKTIDDYEVQNMPMIFAGIPVDGAVVTVLETGRSIKVDPTTGKFSMRLPIGTYTLRAEAYGYFAMEQTVVVEEDQAANANFTLAPISQGTITGQVYDRYYGAPAAYAVIRVAEDPKVAPVTADENGYYVINNVYVGEYTLKVSAKGFIPGNSIAVVVENETTTVNIGLKRFVGYEGGIAYDDGIAEGLSVYMGHEEVAGEGGGVAVRFTPPQYGKVKGANIYFWDSLVEIPPEVLDQRKTMGVVIFGVDEKGETYQVGEPIIQEMVMREWNYIDLSSFEFETDRDFYISTVQVRAFIFVPQIGVDMSSKQYEGRSYFNKLGSITTPVLDNGRFMIRAVMESDIELAITNLPELSYTNQDVITVEGYANGIANIYVNDEKVTSVESVNGMFSAQVPMPADENTIRVTAEVNGIETEPSAPVVVIKDKIAPELTVVNPVDNTKVNVESLYVIGTVSDNIGLSKLEVNGNIVEVAEDGSFDEWIMLVNGVNLITVAATDIAGNVTIVERTVIANIEAPVITNIVPAEDVTLNQGQTVAISFNAPAGGQGYFRVLMPFGLQDNNLGIPMTEVDGLYTGTWTVPEGLVAAELKVEVVYVNEFGTKISKMAEGKLIIEAGDPGPDPEPEPEPEPEGIINLVPNTDVMLSAGETVEISFNAPYNGNAYYRMLLPFGVLGDNRHGVQMQEVEPGFYTAIFTAPANVVASDLQVEIIFIKDGVTLTEIAEGRLTLIGNMENLPISAVIIGDEAFGIDYLNSSAYAQERLIAWYSMGNVAYIKLADDTIVTSDGQQISIEVLPEMVSYYDETGVKLYSK